MAKRTFEFYCSGSCGKYFDFKLNMKLNGNYRIHCPNCKHIHYRVIKNGKISEDRFPENDCEMLIEDICPMKSSCRDVQTETHVENTQTGPGYMANLWKDRHSHKV